MFFFDELGCLGLQRHTALGDELHWRKGGERALALTPADRMLGTLARSPTGYAAGRSPDPQKPLEACPRSPPTRLNFPTPPTHVRVIKGRGARARGPWWLARAPRRVSMKNARCSGDRSGPRGRGSCSLYGVLTLCRVSSVVRYPWFYVAGRGSRCRAPPGRPLVGLLPTQHRHAL